MSESLDVSALSRAVTTLKRALDEYEKDRTNEFVRDACIQRFEYCYDLAAKMIKRYLAVAMANPGEVREMTFQSQIREAYTLGLTQHSWDQWWIYRDNRNKTSHGYNEHTAIEIANELHVFYQEVAYLLRMLVDRDEA